MEGQPANLPRIRLARSYCPEAALHLSAIMNALQPISGALKKTVRKGAVGVSASRNGLSIAPAVVVKKHGGTISFETGCGAGTTFWVQLPFAYPEEA